MSPQGLFSQLRFEVPDGRLDPRLRHPVLPNRGKRVAHLRRRLNPAPPRAAARCTSWSSATRYRSSRGCRTGAPWRHIRRTRPSRSVKHLDQQNAPPGDAPEARFERGLERQLDLSELHSIELQVHGPTLELDPEPDLPLSSAQDLCRLAERLDWHVRPAPDSGRVLVVEHVEEFDQHLRLGTPPDTKPLGDTHIEIDEGRSGKRVASRIDVDTDHRPVPVRIDQDAACGLPAEMKPALRPEDSAHQKLVRQLDEPVDLENMIDRQIGRSLVAVGTVQKRSGLLDEGAVGAGERTVGVGSPGRRLGDGWHRADEAVGR